MAQRDRKQDAVTSSRAGRCRCPGRHRCDRMDHGEDRRCVLRHRRDRWRPRPYPSTKTACRSSGRRRGRASWRPSSTADYLNLASRTSCSTTCSAMTATARPLRAVAIRRQRRRALRQGGGALVRGRTDGLRRRAAPARVHARLALDVATGAQCIARRGARVAARVRDEARGTDGLGSLPTPRGQRVRRWWRAAR